MKRQVRGLATERLTSESAVAREAILEYLKKPENVLKDEAGRPAMAPRRSAKPVSYKKPRHQRSKRK
jgi:hypothetical protein